MYSVILCGGSGTRLWPLSRKNFPKQFLKLYSKYSLLQETFLRMRELMPLKNIFFITNQNNFFNVLNQIKELEKNFSPKQILIEPKSLNTAPAITYAVKYLVDQEGLAPEEPIIFLPSDHYIGKKDIYLSLLKDACKEVKQFIGTIGITPTRPETGYGYIRKGQKHKNYFYVLEFKEKPSREVAQFYLETGEYVWNSGMYIFSPQTLAYELYKHAPNIYKHLTYDFEEFVEKFKDLPSISIDVAISEKSKNVIVFEGNFAWSDIGSFDSLAEIASPQKSRHLNINSENVFIHSTKNRLIVTLGVKDLNIIESNDSILIHKKGLSEEVRKVVDILKKYQYRELEDNVVSYRPWGSFEVLIDSPTYKVKKIVVYPGSKLSLQAHYHRAEHWIVVRGIAKVINGEEELFLRENESTFIPSMSKHRLENPGKINLELIEVQTGNYLDEDDIIRYDDDYNRVKK